MQDTQHMKCVYNLALFQYINRIYRIKTTSIIYIVVLYRTIIAKAYLRIIFVVLKIVLKNKLVRRIYYNCHKHRYIGADNLPEPE